MAVKPIRLLPLLFVFSACSVFGIRGDTPEPRYQVIGQIGAMQIRHYDARLVAQTNVSGTEIEARYKGFKRLAAFIFGANHRRARIAMTAPVAQQRRIAMTAPISQQALARQRQADGDWRIRFTMAAGYTRASLPEPDDSAIHIVLVPARDYAVVRYTGLPSAGAVRRAKARLLAGLAGSDWRIAGRPVAWFYDPPWAIPFLRRNEEALPVTPG